LSVFSFSITQCCGSESRMYHDPGWVKNQDPDPELTTRIIFPRAWKFFWFKILKSFDVDLGWKISDPGWKKFGSGINIPDPQHCYYRYPFLPTKF
jgi:hypothetical protein